MILQTFFSEETLVLMDKYGVSFVMLIVFTGIVWYMLRSIIKRQNKQDEIQNQILKNVLNKEDSILIHKKEMMDYAENTGKAQQLLYLLMSELSADRVSVFEFHNGNKSFSGVDFKKCSNTFEATELGIESKYKEYQNIPISVNFLWNKLLVDKTPILISDIDSLKNKDNTIYIILNQQGIKSYYSRLIYDYDGLPIGFINVVYYKEKLSLEHEHLKKFNDVSIQISSLMKKK